MRSRYLFALAALAAALTIARADTPPASPARAASLRDVALAFAKDGDAAHAREALAALQASPAELAAVLREPARPAEAPKGGTQTLTITDVDGLATDLVVIAPDAETLRKRTKPLGLVVMLHGLGGRGQNAIRFSDALVATGEVVCVAPTAKKIATDEPIPEDGIPGLVRTQFKHWWVYEGPRSFPMIALEKARELFWIDPERVTLAGMSMGGYGTWNIGLRHPDRFAALVPLAGGVSRFCVTSDKDAYSKALLENGRTLPVLSAHGRKDFLVPFQPDQEACEYLESIGGKAIFHPLDSGHELNGVHRGDNAALMDQIVSFLVNAKRAVPEAVTYVATSDRLDGAHWLRIRQRQAVARPRIEGRIDRAANRVTVTHSGVKKARVYLDERLLDLEREVEVVANGQVVFRGRVQPSLDSVLESWRSRRDPGLVYSAHVDLGTRWF